MSERYVVTRGFLLAAVLLLVLSFQNSEAQDDFVPDELIIKLKKLLSGKILRTTLFWKV